jgi:hypothetical protein
MKRFSIFGFVLIAIIGMLLLFGNSQKSIETDKISYSIEQSQDYESHDLACNCPNHVGDYITNYKTFPGTKKSSFIGTNSLSKQDQCYKLHVAPDPANSNIRSKKIYLFNMSYKSPYPMICWNWKFKDLVNLKEQRDSKLLESLFLLKRIFFSWLTEQVVLNFV